MTKLNKNFNVLVFIPMCHVKKNLSKEQKILKHEYFGNRNKKTSILSSLIW